jgi:hypothetical protein
MKRTPIEQRIRAALAGRLRAPYHDLMDAVFPAEQYPRAMRYQSNGGPPGCAMAFNAALRRMGGGWSGMGSARVAWVPKTGSTR